MKKYNIVEINQPEIVLASCPTLERAAYYLQVMTTTDLQLKEYYNWKNVPQYTIIETTEEDHN